MASLAGPTEVGEAKEPIALMAQPSGRSSVQPSRRLRLWDGTLALLRRPSGLLRSANVAFFVGVLFFRNLSVRKIHPPNRNRYKIGPGLDGLSLLIRNCSKGLIRGHSPDQGGSRPTSSLASFLLPPVPCSPCGQADGQQRIYRRHTIRLI